MGRAPTTRAQHRHGRTVSLVAILAGCPAACGAFQSSPEPPAGILERLDLAEIRIAGERPREALDLLPDDVETAPRGLQPRILRIRAEALLADGEAWQVYTTLRRFSVDYPLSQERSRVQEILYRAGESLITQDTGWWVNTFSDYGSNSGDVILAHLVTTYPESPRVADAYRLRGDWHLKRGEFEAANDRFRSLVFARPDSEWTPYALYQIAMSQFFQLAGPEYDLEEMNLARQELMELLRNPPERPDFLASAQQALATVNLWICTRHLQIADYYRQVGNRPGERLHLERAVAAGPDLAPGRAAAARLQNWTDDGAGGDPDPGTEATEDRDANP